MPGFSPMGSDFYSNLPSACSRGTPKCYKLIKTAKNMMQIIFFSPGLSHLYEPFERGEDKNRTH